MRLSGPSSGDGEGSGFEAVFGWSKYLDRSASTTGQTVTGRFFELVGVAPLAGRTINDEDTCGGTPLHNEAAQANGIGLDRLLTLPSAASASWMRIPAHVNNRSGVM